MNKSSEKIALILAAGKGKRMKSDLPKVLQKLDGRYVIDYVIDSARKAGIERQILVVGHRSEMVEEALKDRGVEFVLQAEQLGTGHAVMMAEPLLAGFDGDLVVLCGDMPLVRPESIKGLIDERHKFNAAAVVLTTILEDPACYGRILRDNDAFLKAIVEYRDADDNIRKIKEVNTATYCFDWKELKPILSRLDDNNDQREYYLTDSIAILVNNGRKVSALVAADPAEGFGINSEDELSAVEKLLKSGTR